MTIGGMAGTVGNATSGVLHLAEGRTVEGVVHLIIATGAYYAGQQVLESFSDDLDEIMLKINQ